MRYHGHLDSVDDGVITGWCVDLDDVRRKTIVDILVDGVLIARPLCCEPREDVVRLGAAEGNGEVGFCVRLPAEFSDGLIRSIEARDPSGKVLYGSPIFSETGRGQRRDLEHQGSKMSIVMPTYNRAAVLERSLRRCLSIADPVRYEFVVVDDGSKDDTKDILSQLCMEYHNLRAFSVKNNGPGTARNIAVMEALFDVVLFIGDDIYPTSPDFFDIHADFHAKAGRERLAMLGKTIWPRFGEFSPNFVMNRIQGDGQQQFGYKYMMPFRKFDWPFFYTSNISIRKNIVADWRSEGFDAEFTRASFEDGEFAIRMKKRFPDFGIIYVPTASAEHLHKHSVRTFIGRQVNAGFSANVLLRKHPEMVDNLGLTDIVGALIGSEGMESPNVAHYLAITKGIEAWACLLEETGELGTQNWHAEFLDAVFTLAFYQGFIQGFRLPRSNFSAAMKLAFEKFQALVGRAFAHEALGDLSFR
jgi:glycosyltransferase involved in cell wall biosynthesis